MSGSSVGVHNCRNIAIMFPQMSIQIGLLTKGPLAERAAEGLLFVMNISNVALQIGGN